VIGVLARRTILLRAKGKSLFAFAKVACCHRSFGRRPVEYGRSNRLSISPRDTLKGVGSIRLVSRGLADRSQQVSELRDVGPECDWERRDAGTIPAASIRLATLAHGRPAGRGKTINLTCAQAASRMEPCISNGNCVEGSRPTRRARSWQTGYAVHYTEARSRTVSESNALSKRSASNDVRSDLTEGLR
jgi:hypothetical protein